MVPWRGHSGLTLVELLLVIAILALIAGLALHGAAARPAAASVARELAALLTSTRWLASSSGQPLSLLRSPGSGGALVRVAGYACDPADGGALWAPPARTEFTWPALGLAFAPDGRPRRCDGSAVGNNTIAVEGARGDRAAVIVASLGRVRWERR